MEKGAEISLARASGGRGDVCATYSLGHLHLFFKNKEEKQIFGGVGFFLVLQSSSVYTRVGLGAVI